MVLISLNTHGFSQDDHPHNNNGHQDRSVRYEEDPHSDLYVHCTVPNIFTVLTITITITATTFKSSRSTNEKKRKSCMDVDNSAWTEIWMHS